MSHTHNCLTCERTFDCDRHGDACEELIALVTEGCATFDTCDTHRIREKRERGLPIIGRNKGGYCIKCGDYVRHVDREAVQRTETKGCDSCTPSYKKKYADDAIIDGLEFK